MCHVSVGHVARLLEQAGVATVVVAVRAFRPRMEPMMLPRLLLTPHSMGRPFGAPGDRETQQAVILAASKLLETVRGSGTIVEMKSAYRPGHLT